MLRMMIVCQVMSDDWRYTPQKMKLRQECLKLLLTKYGCKGYHAQSIYECAHDWISQGNSNTEKLVSFYKRYYETKRHHQTGEESVKKP